MAKTKPITIDKKKFDALLKKMAQDAAVAS